MGNSLKFKHIAKNACKLIDLIYNSQNVLRYIHYLTDDPLATTTINREGVVVSQPNVNVSLEDSGIEMVDFDEDMILQSQVKLFINPFKGNITSRKTLGEDIYVLNIICNRDYNLLRGLGEYRDFNIAYEISQLIDQKSVAGIGQIDIVSWNKGKLDKSHTCLTLFIKLNNITNKEKI